MKIISLFVVFLAFVQYVQCDPDPTCEFGVTGTPTPFFYGGVRYVGSDICCPISCGTCGGSGCGAREGVCCAGPIIDSGISCDDEVAPCVISEPIITPAPTPEPVTDPLCQFGIMKDNICCSSECGQCGGVGCGSRPGGGSNCCGGPILSGGLSCDDGLAPCVIGGAQCEPEEGVTVSSTTHPKANGCYTFSGYDYQGFTQFGTSDAVIWPMEYNFGNGNVDRWEFAFENTIDDFIVCVTNSQPVGNPGKGGVEIVSCNSGQSLPIELSFSCGCSEPETDPTCEFGIVKQDVCCPTECGTCGGVGCSLRPGGSDCCGGPIRASGLSCDDHMAPCVIGLP